MAQRLLTRYGWRNTTISQIAREAGVSPAGLLHHFESKERLLHAVLEARDTFDATHLDTSGDVIEQIERVPERFEQAPDLIGTFVVLLIENLNPDAPLHERLLGRYRFALEAVAEGIRREQRAGRYRTDVDPALKAVEILAFLYGMETSWLLDPSIPVTEAIKAYARSLAHQLTSPAGAR